ncbi:MAG TPA: DedA family protein [Thermoflexales bacterium]|nr:DedA family protein [Thermoflexales bacterium]HQW35378.1 DedA family protein [Thermoflexales bacterium]HQZ22074.1 DedA family protein [Thermoflexales bacterium]HQZ99986.1 DedA family protein [Thermoflexales bacterium]
MDLIKQLVDIVLHVDKYLVQLIQQFGVLTYVILFGIIFCETGLVVTPFLPGDSLLFAAGALSAADTSNTLQVVPLWIVMCIAAVLGDSVNYAIGRRIGPRAFDGTNRFLKPEYLKKTEDFYAKHGGKTIILARFVPIVRTFAPFVAGVGNMAYSKFFSFNVIGGIAWVSLFVWMGYLFGNIPFVKANFELVIIGIILVSVVPIGIEWMKARREKNNA